MATRMPTAESFIESHATSGVLPVPPTVRLPTTTTGHTDLDAMPETQAIQHAAKRHERAVKPGKRRQPHGAAAPVPHLLYCTH